MGGCLQTAIKSLEYFLNLDSKYSEPGFALVEEPGCIIVMHQVLVLVVDKQQRHDARSS